MEQEKSRLPAPFFVGIVVAVLGFAGLAVILFRGPGARANKAPAAPAAKTVATTVRQRQRPEPIATPPVRTPEPVRLAAAGRIKPTADHEGQSWSLDQFHAYLAERGIESKAAERMQATTPGLWLTPATGGGPNVLVEQFPDAETARQAAKTQAERNSKSISWGRFLIVGRDGEFFRRIRASLES